MLSCVDKFIMTVFVEIVMEVEHFSNYFIKFFNYKLAVKLKIFEASQNHNFHHRIPHIISLHTFAIKNTTVCDESMKAMIKEMSMRAIYPSYLFSLWCWFIKESSRDAGKWRERDGINCNIHKVFHALVFRNINARVF